MDALFGTGIKGAVTGVASTLISSMNLSGKPIVAVDVPSGLDSDTGKAEGSVVRATLTVTFAAAKFGLLEYPGVNYSGEVSVVDIGMPREVTDKLQSRAYVTESKNIAHWLPRRSNARDANKGTYGHVVVFAGSKDVVGAPVMVAEAASRTGAGLVTLVVPSDLKHSVMARVSPVIMTLVNAGVEHALTVIEKTSAVALGPGIGLSEDIKKFVMEFVMRCPLPLVIDADALTLLSHEHDQGEAVIKNRTAPTVLTPHPAEMGRLLDLSTKAIQEDRRNAVTMAAKKYACVVLLKGAHTLVADDGGSLYVNTTGNPGMATGGSGDVLTGVIAALIAQHLAPFEAAVAGVYVHGLAGDLALSSITGATGMIATDMIGHLPLAISQCQIE